MRHDEHSEGACRAGWPRDLNPREPYTRFGLVRRCPTANANWFQKHWLGFMLLVQLCLTAVFIFVAARYGFTGTTVLFGLLAAYNLAAFLTWLLFADCFWIRQRITPNQIERS